MKKIIALLMSLLCVVGVFTACGGEDAESSVEESKGAVNDTTVADTTEAGTTEADTTDESKPVADVSVIGALKNDVTDAMEADAFAYDPNAVFNETGINPETYVDGFWLYDVDSITAEQVAVYRATSADNAEAIKGLLSTKLASLTAQYQSYNQDNYNMALKAVVGVSGEYAYLVMSPKVSEIEAIVKDAIGA